MPASNRSENLADKEKVREKLLKLYKHVEAGYASMAERGQDIRANWKIFRCELDDNQLFYGRNQLYAPLVYDAVRARATRFTNQLFPQNGRHVECTSADGTLPRAALAVVEHHIDKAGLRELIPALVISGDCEGTYNLYTEWRSEKRYTTRRVKKPVEIEGIPVGKVEDQEEEEEVSVGGPLTEIIPDMDVCVLPATAATIDDAIAQGGSVTILRRWNKQKIKQAIKNKDIDKEQGERLLEDLDHKEDGIYVDADKDSAKSAGVKKDGRGSWALVYEIWTNLPIAKGEDKDADDERLCQVFMANPDAVLMARRNPLWCDKLPLLSIPVQRQPGTCKGQAPVSAVAPLQYAATDALNEAMDSAAYCLLPIIKKDPQITAPLVYSPGAIWDAAPGDLDIINFPPLWREGFAIIEDLQMKINQTLSVSPAMMTQGPQKVKKNQAEIAQQQQVEMLTTADAVRVMESLLTDLVQLWLDMDYQYRDSTVMARQYGQMGRMAGVEAVPPLQNDTRYVTRWVGVEVAKSAQMTQQKIAMLGVMRAIPPASYPDYTFNAQPIMVDLVESTCGPQQARLILEDKRSLLSTDPEIENQMMDEGMQVPVHQTDNDEQHVAAHMASIQKDGDPSELKLVHVASHKAAAMVKLIAQKQAMNPSKPQGGGGGTPAGAVTQPGAGQPGQTPPGAQPRGPQGLQQPPGAIHPDQMQDANKMPRPQMM